MTSRLLLAAFFPICLAGADPQSEKLSSVEAYFQHEDLALDWFYVLAKQPVAAGDSILVVEAAPTGSRGGSRVPLMDRMLTGVFVVSGDANQVRQVLDRFPTQSLTGTPVIETDPRSAVLHFYSDYGIYQGSIKYFFNLAGTATSRKIPFKILSLAASTAREGKLYYATNAGSNVVISPTAGGLPSYKIVDGVLEPASIQLPDGAEVVNTTPPGQARHKSGVSIAGGARKQFFPVPVVSADFYRQARPKQQTPGEIENNIGPYAFVNGKIWFANKFYDGEGTSGVGAIGEFDIAAQRYEMHYVPEIAPWSGSAMLADGFEL